MARHFIASLLPVLLLVPGGLLGGIWAWAALAGLTVLVHVLDRIELDQRRTERSGQVLSVLLAALHFPALALGVAAVAGATGLGVLDRIVIFFAFGLFFGQIGNSNAHELIHAGPRALRRLGGAVYVSLLFGHHVSAHLLVHHAHVATPRDPNSARRGEGFYAFALRAWAGSLRAGMAAEAARRRGRRRGVPPHAVYALGALAALAVSGAIAGPAGIAAHLALAAYAQMQLLLSDYVQHYGLRRSTGNDGRAEPAGPHHSWNAPHWYSSAMMLNAPRHSDHHLNPRRPYPALRNDPDTMPQLPHSLPVMATIALIPPLWRRIMAPHLRRWQNGAGAAAPGDKRFPEARGSVRIGA